MDRGYAPQTGADGVRARPRRPVTDYGSTMVQWMRHRRPRYKGSAVMEMERPSVSYVVDMLPPSARLSRAVDSIPAKCLHSSQNKQKFVITVVRWTPEGRRLLTASMSGEFTIWNGMGFNFETIMQAHESPIRCAIYSHNGEWLISADKDREIRYWQPNFNRVNRLRNAHGNEIRDLAFAPTDSKFVSASDDTTMKIWDFARAQADSTLTGHQWDVKTVDWHPTKGLIVSGSKDNNVKLWDPRTGRCLTTLHGHRNAISKTLFEPTQGDLLATSARDPVARIFDLRMMRDVLLLKGHEKEITTLTWHPIHKNLLSTAGFDGSMYHWLLDEQNAPAGTAPSLSPYESRDPLSAPAQTIYPAHRLEKGHEYAIYTLDWHPLGHILASGSTDKITRFWTRTRPGDNYCFHDRYHLGQKEAEAQGTWNRQDGRRQRMEEEEFEAEDEAEGLVDQKMPSKHSLVPPGLPGIGDGTSGGGQLPGIGNAPLPPAPAGLPNVPGMDQRGQLDLSQLQHLFGGQFPPPPPPPPGFPAGFPAAGPPPPPPGVLGLQFPPGFPPPPPPPGVSVPGLPGQGGLQNGGADAAGVRKRAPLPSQRESLREEMRRGNYRTAR